MASSRDFTASIDAALVEALAPGLARAPRLCVALSGGRDSVVLLHALSRLLGEGRLTAELTALHVHHGLSDNAEDWVAFCADWCDALGVPLRVARVAVRRDSGEGIEGAARRARHAVFAATPVDWLVLAHHRDDQAETVLLNLLRGAGVAGAAGMPRMRSVAGGPVLLRPLLDVPRRAIEHYAEAHALRWIEDESNANRHFRRNFLRHEALPLLETAFPGARQSLARAADHFGEATQLLDELAGQDAAAIRQPSGRLGLMAFNRLTPANARNVLRHALRAAGFRAPAARWLEEACRQLAATDAGSETCVTTPDGALQVYRGELYLIAHTPPAPGAPLPWAGETELAWAGGRVRFEQVCGAGIRAAALASGTLELRARQGGERFRPQAGRPRRNLRNLLQEAALPPWERARLPLGWSGNRLVWVGGFGVDADCMAGADETGLLPVWLPAG
ncbi:tRNA lysidine(34) synthetase TilS [uncultured Propionivibrio sp.]|uniref:tRNA lysidine(34) synthetase TilS n=1 Tax=uncultured Propionivibrio sp. TaxID=426737 RepID=UPI0029C0E5BF|nr:tRNA lysidine(34) synthetase TilS [uncultured Propionivibrio sp.]